MSGRGVATLDHAVATAITGLGESYLPIRLAVPGRGEQGWTRFADAVTDDALVDRLAQMAPDYESDAIVTTAFLASRLLSPVAMLGARPVAVQGRALRLDPAAVWLHRHPRGWNDGIALGAPVLVVAADDPLAGRDGVEVVADLAAVREVAVASMMVLGELVVDGLRAHGQLGHRALWGQLADMVVTAAARPHDASGDDVAARAEAEALVASDDRLWVTPTIARVEVDGGVGLAWRRGSCCLAYKLERFGYCTGCPLIDEAEWWERSVASVRERVGGGA